MFRSRLCGCYSSFRWKCCPSCSSFSPLRGPSASPCRLGAGGPVHPRPHGKALRWWLVQTWTHPNSSECLSLWACSSRIWTRRPICARLDWKIVRRWLLQAGSLCVIVWNKLLKECCFFSWKDACLVKFANIRFIIVGNLGGAVAASILLWKIE